MHSKYQCSLSSSGITLRPIYLPSFPNIDNLIYLPFKNVVYSPQLILSFNSDAFMTDPTNPYSLLVQQFPSKTSSYLILASMVDVKTPLHSPDF